MIRRSEQLKESAQWLSTALKQQKGDPLATYRHFRKREEHRLRIRHNAKGSGREITRHRSDLSDIIFRELFKNQLETSRLDQPDHGLVVMAFGGYGRREMNPFSDVDIMFVYKDRQSLEASGDLIRHTLTALWDMGFKVGHSTRSISEAIFQANADMVVKTSLLEARYLVGHSSLYQAFKSRFFTACVKGQSDAYIDWRLSNQQDLRKKYGSSVYMQEPNVKHGRGGMRDYQSMVWIAFFKERVASLSKLVQKQFLREEEHRMLNRAYDFLLRVRSEMHYLNGRPIDCLTLQMQGRIASRFGYPQKHILGRSEAFMRDYYRHTRDIDRITTMVMDRMKKNHSYSGGVFSLLSKHRTHVESFDGFYISNQSLFAENQSIFDKEPARLLRAFRYIQEKQVSLGSNLRELISHRLGLVNRDFQYSKVHSEIFLAILSYKGAVGSVLRLMHETGLLGRYIPEFGALTCLVQHEFYHRYTADEHTLLCLEKLDSILETEDPKLVAYRHIFQLLEDPAILYLALLLHDTGKASNFHSHEKQSTFLAQHVVRRLRLSLQRRLQLLLLVKHHYTLSQIAQNRNLEDTTTIREFANTIKTLPSLDALMLLTLADGMGTSDQNWSDWKEALVWQLYDHTKDFLGSSKKYVSDHGKRRDQLVQQVRAALPKDFSEEITVHFTTMPARYFASFDAKDIVTHLQLFRSFFQRYLKDMKAVIPVMQWVAHPEKGHSEVLICGWNRQRLLQRLSGAFLSAEINVLSADIFTRGDDLALDIFRVCNANSQAISNPKEIQQVEQMVAQAFGGEDFDFSPFIGKRTGIKPYRLSQEVTLPTLVTVENDKHPIYTLVEVQTPDRLGLLYDLLKAINNCGAHIELSRITTESGVALDTFYITAAEGRKLRSDEIAIQLRTALTQAAKGRKSSTN